mmetsp:Transcript_82775/g.198651  ORF Transcript_82775/g.198651 Transcript_82775/m.198651 type:complete len:248 (-) Transcript_82775:824-1567(-)
MLQHGHGQREPHPPAGGQLRDRVVQLGIVEAHLQQGLPPSIIDADILGHLDAVLQRCQVALAHFSQLRVVDVDALQVRRHAHDAMCGDFFHKGGLAGPVVTYHTIPAILPHLQRGVLEQQVPRTIHQEQVLYSKQHFIIIVASVSVGIERVPQGCAHYGFADARDIIGVWDLTDLLAECQGCGHIFGQSGNLLPAVEVFVLLPLDDDRRSDGTQMRPHAWHQFGQVRVARHLLASFGGELRGINFTT